MPDFNAFVVLGSGARPVKMAAWMSADEYLPARRMTISSSLSSHSSTAPGPAPSFLRTCEGTEIWP